MERSRQYSTPYEFKGPLPLRQAIPLGLQHVLAMFVGNLTPILIITNLCAAGGGAEDFAAIQVTLLQNAMLVAGIVTLVQLFSIGPVGGQVPIIMGTSSGFIGVFQSVVNVMGGGILAYGAIMGASILGGLFETVLGLAFLLPLRFFKKPGNRLSIVIGMVFLAVALADFAGFSALLVCMMMGAVFVNLSSQSANVMSITDGFTPPILMLFFVLSGAELNIGLLPQLGLVGILYVVTRVIGKFLGAFAGSRLMKAPPVVSKFLGFALIPQAGVAIGLSLVAESVVPEYGAAIRAVVLCATLIYEMIGPVVTKLALKGAGEITEAA